MDATRFVGEGGGFHLERGGHCWIVRGNGWCHPATREEVILWNRLEDALAALERERGE